MGPSLKPALWGTAHMHHLSRVLAGRPLLRFRGLPVAGGGPAPLRMHLGPDFPFSIRCQSFWIRAHHHDLILTGFSLSGRSYFQKRSCLGVLAVRTPTDHCGGHSSAHPNKSARRQRAGPVGLPDWDGRGLYLAPSEGFARQHAGPRVPQSSGPGSPQGQRQRYPHPMLRGMCAHAAACQRQRRVHSGTCRVPLGRG